MAPRTPAQAHIRRSWAAVTIRVAWELHNAGVRPSSGVLAQARTHVQLSLPHGIGRLQAEELAAAFTREYLRRVQKGEYRRVTLPKDPVPPRPSWRERLVESLDPVGEVVLRLIHGDGLSLEEVERITRVDRVVLQAAQQGVRGAMRAIMSQDGVPVPLEAAAFDRLLARTARLPAADCHGGAEVATPAGAPHAERCPRCSRAVRLIRAGALAPSELIAPEHIPPSPSLSVLALHLHPSAHHHRGALIKALAPGAIRADQDTLLVDLDRVDNHVAILHSLTAESTPRREHLRGAMVRGAGLWCSVGLLGPVATAGVELTRSRSWAEVDSCGTLPEPLPEPEAATRLWSAALLTTLLAALLGLWTLLPSQVTPDHPVVGTFSQRSGATATFDLDDQAYLLVVALNSDGSLHQLHSSTKLWDKAELATGDGRYRIHHEQATRLLVASAATPFERPDLLRIAQESGDPLGVLVETLPKAWPGVGLLVQEPPPSVPSPPASP